MVRKVLSTIERHAMFSPGMRLGVAVSGGADSMCLLHVLHELTPHWNLHLHVVHIDHGVRGQASMQDAEFVEAAATQLALAFHKLEAKLEMGAGNFEQEARRARHGFYRQLIEQGTVERVATGHTQSDQAETVMYRLLRGSGLAGLRGILPITGDGMARPLLDLTRVEIENWLRGRGIAWREDSTNLDPKFARNRLRHETLPMLREAYNPQLDLNLAHLATLAQEEEDYWEGVLGPAQLAQRAACYPIESFSGVPPALARRRIRQAIQSAKGDLRRIDFNHVDAVLAMAVSTDGDGRIHLPDVDVRRSFDWVRFSPAARRGDGLSSFRYKVTPPVTLTIPENRGSVTFELIKLTDIDDRHVRVGSELDWESLTFCSTPDAALLNAGKSGSLELRNWRPGDRIRCTDRPHEQKLKILFQDARIPVWDRHSWPVLACGQVVLWTRQFGPSVEYTPGPGTRWILRIHDDAGAIPGNNTGS